MVLVHQICRGDILDLTQRRRGRSQERETPARPLGSVVCDGFVVVVQPLRGIGRVLLIREEGQWVRLCEIPRSSLRSAVE